MGEQAGDAYAVVAFRDELGGWQAGLLPETLGDDLDGVVAAVRQQPRPESALALVNVAKMLRPGGFLLTNTALPLLPRSPMALVGYTDVGYTERPEADRIFWWERE